MSLPIETNAPFAKPKGRVEDSRGTKIREAMQQMLVGGSFFWPCKDWFEERMVRNTVTRVQHRTFNNERKFAGRKMVDVGGVGIRIKRIK